MVEHRKALEGHRDRVLGTEWFAKRRLSQEFLAKRKFGRPGRPVGTSDRKGNLSLVPQGRAHASGQGSPGPLASGRHGTRALDDTDAYLWFAYIEHPDHFDVCDQILYAMFDAGCAGLDKHSISYTPRADASLSAEGNEPITMRFSPSKSAIPFPIGDQFSPKVRSGLP
jgi:hypothetical protein